jgi:hypothetical protein
MTCCQSINGSNQTQTRGYLTMKNVYIISEVLSDYTSGMVVIVASDLAECRSIFEDQFYNLEEFDSAISDNKYQVIPTDANQESRLVSYVYGGG